MIQCKDCEYCEMSDDGQVRFRCNPFSTIVEPECLVKHQLLRLEMMTRAHMATVAAYKKIAPLQDKLFKHLKREMDDLDEADSWKYDDEEEDDEDDLPPLDDRL